MSRSHVLLLGLAIASLPTVGARAESLAVSPAAFVANTVFVQTQMSPEGVRTSVFAGCEVAPVQLPHGAVLDSLLFWVRDDDSGSGADVTVTLWQKNTTLDNDAFPVMQGSSSGSNPAIRAVLDFPPSPYDVDTADETFTLEACYGDAGLELHDIVIGYTGPAAGIDTASPAVIPPASFRSVSGRPAVFDVIDGSVSASSLNGGQPTDCLVAPVHLPDGVHLDSLEAILYDTDSDDNLGLRLMRKRLGTGQVSQDLGGVWTLGTSGRQVRETTDLDHRIVDHAYAYFLATPEPCATTNTSHRIYSVRIRHSTPLFADGFESGDTSSWTSEPDPPSTRLQLPGAAFLPALSGSVSHGVDVDEGQLELGDSTCTVAPAMLPNGASLLLMTAFVDDPDSSRSLSVRLKRKPDNGPAASVLATATSSGSGGPTAAFGLPSGTVDADAYQYFVEACGPAGAAADAFGIQSVLIDYAMP